MNAFKTGIATLALAVMGAPPAFAAGHYEGNSIEVLAGDNAPARDCYRAASIAARIHYTSRRELERCDEALNYTALTPRDRAATLANRGIILMSLEEFQRAIQDYTTALALKPEFGELNVNIGNIYYLGKSYDKAVAEYTTAIEKQSSRIQIAYMNRGMAYENLGRLAEAEADMLMALQIAPEWEAAKKQLDELREKIRNPAPTSASPAASP